MRKYMVPFMGLVLATSILASLCFAVGSSASTGYGGSPAIATRAVVQAQSSSQPTGISVSGTGKVTAIPDVAILRLGVEATAKTVAETRNQAATAMDAVLNSLKANGVNPKDIQTQYLSIYPITRWIETDQQEIIVGYRVTNMVTAKIRKVGDAGLVIDSAVKAGGDLIRVQGISFTIDDPSIYYSQARQKAMADAKAKAQELATLAGVGLGRPIYISEGGGYVPMPIYETRTMAAGDATAPTPISPGELEISLSVQVLYAIE